VGVDVNRLIHVELTVGSPTKGVHDVMGVLGAESGQQDAFLVRLVVAVLVFEMEHFGALADVTAAIARFDARGNEQAIHKDG
jgi:hypothetical protein